MFHKYKYIHVSAFSAESTRIVIIESRVPITQTLRETKERNASRRKILNAIYERAADQASKGASIRSFETNSLRIYLLFGYVCVVWKPPEAVLASVDRDIYKYWTVVRGRGL